MESTVSRRRFFTTATAAAAVPVFTRSANATPGKTLIIGVACSPRKGKTTSTAVGAALKAAESVNPEIETELIDLGDMDISGWVGGAKPDQMAEIMDDFDLILPSFQAPNLGGLIIGSPVYFRSMSALCKAFLERLAVLRKPEFKLADVPVAALAVGSYRNGGQELVIEQIVTAMLCHEVFVVGGKPRAHQGATLWNAYDDDITQDELGMTSARNVGIRVAEAALKVKS